MEKDILRNISIIVAMAENRAIGKDNRLLWHISEDLKRFRKLTTGHALIMGRNTFYSLPNGALPNRRHVVLSNIPGEVCPACEMATTLEEAVDRVRDEDEAFVIGGGMVYEQFLPLAGKLYLTLVHGEFEADTYFPEIDFSQWRPLAEERIPAGEKNMYAHTYTEYERIVP